MVKMNGCAAIDIARPFRFLADKAAVAADFHFGKQCTAVPTSHYLPTAKRTWQAMLGLYTRAILLGKSPKPLNDFREIGYAPTELNINLSSENESGIFGFTAFRQIRF